MRVLAIDPGNIDSGWCVIDTADCSLVEFGKQDSNVLLARVAAHEPDYDAVVIEMIASYGMSVGAEIFQTCVWIGRYQQAALTTGAPVTLTYRRDVRLHHCHDTKAKDGNVTQALIDRFAPGVSNHGKGSKAAPGFFYGFYKDVWQAFALAVHYADTRAEGLRQLFDSADRSAAGDGGWSTSIEP